MPTYEASYLLQIDIEATHADLDELPLVDEDLVVVAATRLEYLGAQGGFEPTAFLDRAGEVLVIERQLVTGSLDIPGEECCVREYLRAEKPSGTLTMT